MNHRTLCIIGAKYLRIRGLNPFSRCQYSVCELERIGECPDAFGWGNSTSQLIEAKASRSDFLSDKKKMWRRTPEFGIGVLRSYICPEGLIKSDEIPEFWGLLYVDEKGKITVIKQPEKQPSNHMEEMNLVTSILRREGVKKQMFSYKKYKTDTNNGVVK